MSKIINKSPDNQSIEKLLGKNFEVISFSSKTDNLNNLSSHIRKRPVDISARSHWRAT